MSKTEDGNFKYNGVPVFNVGSLDFAYFINCHESGSRILSKNIKHDKLQEHYKKSRTNNFGICYEGVIIDLRTLKKKVIKE